jgi:hypothetical protein
VISIDMKNSGAGTVTPPAFGLCSSGTADQVVLMAPYAASWDGTALPSGTAAPIRLRGLSATTGVVLGATVRPSVQTTALKELAVDGVPSGRTSSTPGDLPPEDPLS